MATRNVTLVVDVGAGRLAETVSRMRRLRLPVLHAKSLDETERLLEAEGAHVRAVLFPPTLGAGELAGLRARILEQAFERPATLVVVGPKPAPERRAELRAAGVELALWEPFDDGVLRFVVNEAGAPSDVIAARGGVRVPTDLQATAEVGGRARPVHIYSLSSHGAFLETPRASVRGARLKLEIPLPDGALRIEARVVFSNVPGNLQRPKLPLGMGVRFEGLELDATARLRRFIEARASQICV